MCANRMISITQVPSGDENSSPMPIFSLCSLVTRFILFPVFHFVPLGCFDSSFSLSFFFIMVIKREELDWTRHSPVRGMFLFRSLLHPHTFTSKNVPGLTLYFYSFS
jgi:hypothetical protein